MIKDDSTEDKLIGTTLICHRAVGTGIVQQTRIIENTGGAPIVRKPPVYSVLQAYILDARIG